MNRLAHCLIRHRVLLVTTPFVLLLAVASAQQQGGQSADPEQAALQFSVYSGTLDWQQPVTDAEYLGL